MCVQSYSRTNDNLPTVCFTRINIALFPITFYKCFAVTCCSLSCLSSEQPVFLCLCLPNPGIYKFQVLLWSHKMKAKLMSLSYDCLSTSFAWCVASRPSFIHLLVSVVVWYYIVECSLFSIAQKLSFSFCSSFGKTHKQSLFSFLLIRKSTDICPIQSLYICTLSFSIVPSSDREGRWIWFNGCGYETLLARWLPKISMKRSSWTAKVKTVCWNYHLITN